MDTTLLSKTMQRQSEDYGLSPEEMAFATLMSNGWTMIDAIRIMGLSPEDVSSTTARKIADKIMAKEGYSKYINGEDMEGNPVSNDNTPQRRHGKKLRDKDAVLKAMEKEADQMTGLDKIRALKEIAELQQMKKETNKDKEELVKFFLPLTCHNCSLYLEHNNKFV